MTGEKRNKEGALFPRTLYPNKIDNIASKQGNIASYKICDYTSKMPAGIFVQHIRVTETTARHCAFCKLKVLRATYSPSRACAYIWVAIYIFYSRLKSEHSCALPATIRRRSRSRLYLFIDWIVARVTKCRREKRVYEMVVRRPSSRQQLCQQN